MLALDDFPAVKRRVNKLLKTMRTKLETIVINGIEAEWALANGKNDAMVEKVAAAGLTAAADSADYFNNHEAALKAFKDRKTSGMNLSKRVWNLTQQYKTELEMALDCGIRDGLSAQEMSRQMKQYLKYPDKLFRRVRDKHGVLQLSKRAAAYNPGRGIYRSSYKNARRLAATEINIAYRTADHERIQDLDFVVGIRVVLSNNHTTKGPKGLPIPLTDICDELSAPMGSTATKGRGCYPKDFKFTGWHPHCRCHVTSILKTQEEIDSDTQKLLNGEPIDGESVNTVKDVPQAFKDWLTDNDERMQKASSVPYFISDNPKYTGVQPHYGAVGAVTGTKLGRTATKAAFKIYENMQAPTLTAEVAANTEAIAKDFGIKTKPTPMTFLEANEGRGNVFYGKGNAYEENCQAAVVVHEARLRGLNVTAQGYDGTKGSASYQLGERFETIWENAKTHKTPTLTELRGDTFDAMVGKIEKATKATGRYHIGINMQNNEGHVITAERLPNGQMAFYDAQVGAFLKLEEYADSGVEYFEVLKVDKLILRRDIFKKIARLL